jgi:hypothetical protein
MLKMINKKSRDSLHDNIRELLDQIMVDFGGGCGVDKAFIMAWLIAFYKLKKTLDIGVYRGRSLFPQALAHQLYTNGVVYGVDPWTQEDAKEEGYPELKDKIDEFVDKTDFDQIFSQVDAFNKSNGFEKNCILARKKSADAVKYFRDNKIKFDLIHIDGNHDTKFVINDVELYLPLLNKNGFIVMDDISWNSVKPALDVLNNKACLVSLRMDGENDYAIYRNERFKFKSSYLKLILKYVVKK